MLGDKSEVEDLKPKLIRVPDLTPNSLHELMRLLDLYSEATYGVPGLIDMPLPTLSDEELVLQYSPTERQPLALVLSTAIEQVSFGDSYSWISWQSTHRIDRRTRKVRLLDCMIAEALMNHSELSVRVHLDHPYDVPYFGRQRSALVEGIPNPYDGGTSAVLLYGIPIFTFPPGSGAYHSSAFSSQTFHLGALVLGEVPEDKLPFEERAVVMDYRHVLAYRLVQKEINNSAKKAAADVFYVPRKGEVYPMFWLLDKVLIGESTRTQVTYAQPTLDQIDWFMWQVVAFYNRL